MDHDQNPKVVMYDMSTVSFTDESSGGSPVAESPPAYWPQTMPSCDAAYAQSFFAPPPPYAGPHDSLGGYASGYDFPDVNSLEPSLFPAAVSHFASPHPPPPLAAKNSPTGSSSHTSTTSNTSDEGDDFYGCWHPYKKVEAPMVAGGKAARGKTGKKRKPKRDPNEPQKPVSAYALFFRDTQAAIKGQNPNASFGEVSKIVASMWDTLDADAKAAYKLKTETAKKDYLKQLAAYRANLISRSGYVLESPHAQSPPDSTTPGPLAPPPFCDVGERSLASLIAAPVTHHVLTATTTLTVPHSYIPTRGGKSDFESRGEQQDGPWADFQPNSGLLHHCRDVFSIWGQSDGPPNPTPPANVPMAPEFAQ